MHKWRYHPGIELLTNRAVEEARARRRPEDDADRVGEPARRRRRHLGARLARPSIALEVLGRIPEPRAAVAELVAGTATGLVGLLGDDPWFALDISTASSVRRREVRLVCRDGVATLGTPTRDRSS